MFYRQSETNECVTGCLHRVNDRLCRLRNQFRGVCDHKRRGTDPVRRPTILLAGSLIYFDGTSGYS